MAGRGAISGMMKSRELIVDNLVQIGIVVINTLYEYRN
jgi:hypothetical protein